MTRESIKDLNRNFVETRDRRRAQEGDREAVAHQTIGVHMKADATREPNRIVVEEGYVIDEALRQSARERERRQLAGLQAPTVVEIDARPPIAKQEAQAVEGA